MVNQTESQRECASEAQLTEYLQLLKEVRGIQFKAWKIADNIRASVALGVGK